jgi:serine/threonine-protein kinase
VSHAIPADLERVILRCLNKKVDDRPATAHALARELKPCAVTSPWSTDQATAWWQAFRSAGGRSAAENIDPSQVVTMAVDLNERSLPDEVVRH